MAKTIQEILDEQRKESQIFKTSGHTITMTIVNRTRSDDPSWIEATRQAQQRLKQKGFKHGKQAAEARRKPVVTPFGEFISITEFNQWAQQQDFKYKISCGDKIKELPHLYYFKDGEPGEATYQDVAYTPYGFAPKQGGGRAAINIKNLFEAAKQANDPNAGSYNAGEWFRKMLKKDPENYYVKNEPKREWLLVKKDPKNNPKNTNLVNTCKE